MSLQYPEHGFSGEEDEDSMYAVELEAVPEEAFGLEPSPKYRPFWLAKGAFRGGGQGPVVGQLPIRDTCLTDAGEKGVRQTSKSSTGRQSSKDRPLRLASPRESARQAGLQGLTCPARESIRHGALLASARSPVRTSVTREFTLPKGSSREISISKGSSREIFPKPGDQEAPAKCQNADPMDWIVNALNEERQAVDELLARRHKVLLNRMGTELQPRLDGEDLRVLAEAVETPAFTKLAAQRGGTHGSSPSKGFPSEKDSIGSSAKSGGRSPSDMELAMPVRRPSGSSVAISHMAINPGLSKSSNTLRSRVPGQAVNHHGKNKFAAMLETMAHSSAFESFFAALIVLNTVCMAVEVQYLGLGIGHEVGFPGYNKTSEQAWPGGDMAFNMLEWFFGLAFTIEVVAKALATRVSFLRSFWNIFDTIVVTFWLLSRAETITVLMNPTILRLARLVRLLRFLRLIRTVRVFDILQLMIGSLKASIYVLMWSIVLLFFVMTSGCLLLNYWLEPYIKNQTVSLEKRLSIFNLFGTFSRGFLTMFELTLGNWVPVTRVLHDDVSEWFGPVCLVYQGVVVFSVIRVISGIFMHETFQVAGSDDDLMIAQRERQIQKHVVKMSQLFAEADTSGDGYLSSDEFYEVVQDPRIRTWLSAMELEVQDAQSVFHMVEQGDDGCISAEEFVMGLYRLKGFARAMDLAVMMQDVLRLEKRMEMLSEQIGS